MLAEITGDPALRRILVIVVTTSDAEEDVLSSYDSHCIAYVTKPVEFDRFVEIVRRIDAFFMTIVRLPAS